MLPYAAVIYGLSSRLAPTQNTLKRVVTLCFRLEQGNLLGLEMIKAMYDIVELKTPGTSQKMLLDLQHGFGEEKETVLAPLMINGQLYCLKPNGEEWLLEKPVIKKWPIDVFMKENIELLKFFIVCDLEMALERNGHIDDFPAVVSESLSRFFSQEGE